MTRLLGFPGPLPHDQHALLGHGVEIQIELLPSPVGSNALRTGRADCLNGCVHPRPVVDRVGTAHDGLWCVLDDVFLRGCT